MRSNSSYPHVKRMAEVLDQGPIVVEDLILQLMPLVPPGMAWRSAERGRENTNRSYGLSHKPRPVTDKAIRTGQRREIRVQISKLVSQHRAEMFMGEDGQKWIRSIVMSPEEVNRLRSISSKAWWANLSPEERSNIVTKRSATMTPTERSERTRRGWITRRMKRSSMRSSE